MVDDILNEGGRCYTKEDVDKIMEDRNCLERLKAQIRYRKFVMNEKHLNQAFHSAVKKFKENETTGVKGAAKIPLQGRGTASP